MVHYSFLCLPLELVPITTWTSILGVMHECNQFCSPSFHLAGSLWVGLKSGCMSPFAKCQIWWDQQVVCSVVVVYFAWCHWVVECLFDIGRSILLPRWNARFHMPISGKNIGKWKMIKMIICYIGCLITNYYRMVLLVMPKNWVIQIKSNAG